MLEDDKMTGNNHRRIIDQSLCDMHAVHTSLIQVLHVTGKAAYSLVETSVGKLALGGMRVISVEGQHSVSITFTLN